VERKGFLRNLAWVIEGCRDMGEDYIVRNYILTY